MMKTHQATAKRFHVTKSKRKKILKRRAGQDHFNARESGKISRKKRRDVSMSPSFDKTIKRLLSN